MKRVADKSCAVSEPGPDPGFAEAVVAWQKRHGRHALPWQGTRDPYRIWLSEIMLQQTQVATVIPYYLRFLQRFPDVGTLAAAEQETVMSHWSGLGYYSRARNLHRCAKQIVEQYGGTFPADPVLLAELPGIGRSTAAAIAAFSHGARAAILDGNVKRVFARVFGIDGYPGAKPVEDRMWRLAVSLLPESGIEAYTQGLMDLGATICVRGKPSCNACPLSARCSAFAQGRTADLPARKPKKTVPEKSTAMLVLVSGNRVLLERRPDSGIWGGLLSLPEFDIAENDADRNRLLESARRFGEPESCEALPFFSHTFTHFRLHVEPYRISLARISDFAGEASHSWVSADRLADAPLPSPVRKLLCRLFEDAPLFSSRE